MKIDKNQLVSNIGARVDMAQPGTGESTATGLVRGPKGELLLPPGRKSLRTVMRERDGGQLSAADPQPGRSGGSRRKRRQAEPEPAPAPQVVRTRVSVPGLGMVPSEYAHIWSGDGVVVLGLTEMSYLPPAGVVDDDGVHGAVELSQFPGERLVFSGNSFHDGSCRNLIMLRLGENNGREEAIDDGQER